MKNWSTEEEEEEKTKKKEKKTNKEEHECRDVNESWNEENVDKEEEFIKTEQFRLDSETERGKKQHSQGNYEKEEMTKKAKTSFTDENENKTKEDLTEDENTIQTKPVPMPRSNKSSPLRY